METHRYWGIYGGASGPFISGPMRIAEVEFRNYVDGTNLVGSGTVAYPFGGYGDPSGAFDGDPDTDYVSSNQTNAIVGYDFGAPVTVREIALQASQTVPEKMPGIWAIMYSDDGDEWFEEEEFREIADWSAGEIRTIVLDATPDPGGGGGGDGARLEIAHNLITRTGFAGIRLRHVVREFGRSSLALNHSIVIPEGRAVLPVRHQLQAFGPSVLPVRHQVQAPQTGERWQIAVQLDGVDVTDQLNGAVRIEANKSAARIADFVLRPDPGPIDTQAFIKQPVVIDFSTFTASNLQTSHRRFTGIVDDATFDPVSRLISFVCTDDLQGSVEALDFDVIDSVIGGDYSPLIFQRTDNGWEYAQQRLQSQPFSYDKNVFGQPRKWAWQSKAVPDVTVPLIQVIDGSLSHTQSKSRDVVNHVRLEFVHRYGRLWQRELDLVWTYGRSFKDYLFLPSELPNREMFINAIDSTWWVKSLSFTKLPPSGTYPTSGGGLSNWVISDSLRESLIFGARAVLARRWIQDVQEVYHVDVVAPASVDRFGESRVNRRYFSDVPVNERYEDVRGSVPSSSSMGGLSGSAY
uniref:discoidin domain-containing protein n=1 Tax=Methylophaga lonarensis TaxID=999151 RepID=UPI003D27B91A